MKYLEHLLLIIAILFISLKSPAQCLILGADLSYVNTIELNNGEYRNNQGTQVDPFDFFAAEGTNMVRLRLWHTPENITDFCGTNITSNNLQDVLEASVRIKDAGMDIMLALHYGDYFNDPGNQKMPQAWMGLEHQDLLDSIYNYTYHVLEEMNDQGTLPGIIGVGNETTYGFIDATSTTDGWQWPNDAEKFNTAFQAIDDFNVDFGTLVKKAVHFTESSANWLGGLFPSKGISNFDIIGISFYPFYSKNTDLYELGALIKKLNETYEKDIMIFETGFVWKPNGWVDSYNNIMNDNGNVLDFPATPEGQKEYLLALAQTVYDNGGHGLFYWEPAYISSDMCTKWGQGSPYENVCFFDYRDNNKALPAFDFFSFCETLSAEIEDYSPIVISPNPIYTERILIQNHGALHHWKIVDIKGQVILNGQFDIGTTATFINIRKLNDGMYFLYILDPQNPIPFTTKIEIQGN